jgi:MarR family transcriptional regulator, 2-MHQ and catechol-resistance regulon repressor
LKQRACGGGVENEPPCNKKEKIHIESLDIKILYAKLTHRMNESTTGMHLWLVLWKAYKAMEAIDKRSIASLGLGGISDFAILEILLHKGPTPVNTIGKKVGLTSGSITTAVDRAETRGWVKRVAHPNDRRVIHIELTESGREIIDSSMQQHAQVLENAADVLSAEERQTLVGLLKKLGYHAQSLS